MEPVSSSAMSIRFGGAEAARLRSATSPPIPAGELADRQSEIARSVEAAAAFVQALVPVSIPTGRAEAFPRLDRFSRALNVVLASLALILLLPVMLLVAVAIKLSSPGPVFYSQSRVGLDRRAKDRRRRSSGSGTSADGERRNRRASDRRSTNYGGRVFTIYKFRTMVVDAERSGAQWATKDDPRITAIGQFLRRTRLDEIPQLWNVIRGDMNIVGPRPERPAIVLELCRHIPHYPLRHKALPGITGWAQINHSYDNCIDDVRTKVRYDLEYLQRKGLLEDLKIMVRTVPVMLFRRGSQ